jgi:hypothetical protein
MNAPQEILLAEPRGFCAGVDRAIEIVERALQKFGAPIYVRHEIVHNTYVVNDLKAKGAIFIEELADVPPGATLVFSAHGVSRAVQEEAVARGFSIFDATCPLVTKVHVEVAKLAKDRDDPWFFVVTGPFARDTFTEEELAFCEEMVGQVADGRMDNLHIDLSGTRFQDGKPYNAMFTIFDIVWAAYENFEGSSNALTKAAAFRIPLLATKGQCIGGRVQRYQLGRTIPEGDAKAAHAAIQGIIARETEDGRPLVPDFETYHQLHSRAQLDRIFGSLLAVGNAPCERTDSETVETTTGTP